MLSIKIKKEIIESVRAIAKETYPKEFLIFLEGKVKGEEVIAEELVFQPYIASNRSAFVRIDIPLTTNIVGSIHSHPGPRNTPSRADRRFFNRQGLVHGIIAYPYREEDLQFYDIHGNPVVVEIID